MKVLCGVIVLACVSLAPARNNADYPMEKVAELLVEKLDITTLPPEIQPRPEKGKKTFEDYGYVTWKLDEKEVLLEAPHRGSQIAIRVLEQTPNGITFASMLRVSIHAMAVSSECVCLSAKT